jgi:hypothetical protein
MQSVPTLTKVLGISFLLIVFGLGLLTAHAQPPAAAREEEELEELSDEFEEDPTQEWSTASIEPLVTGCQRVTGPQSVVLLAPPDEGCRGLSVTFRWRIKNRDPERRYCAVVVTDKGTNPFDGGCEEAFPAGTATWLRVNLGRSDRQPRYNGKCFEWGVRVTKCEVGAPSCPCRGRLLKSNIRDLCTSSQAPACPM